MGMRQYDSEFSLLAHATGGFKTLLTFLGPNMNYEPTRNVHFSFLKTSSQIVSALSRYPVARARTGGSREKYDTAAQTAFTGREDHTTWRTLTPLKEWNSEN